MNLKCVYLVIIVFACVFSVLSKPVVEIDEEHILDSKKPSAKSQPHKANHKTPSIKNKDDAQVDLKEETPKSERTKENAHKSSKKLDSGMKSVEDKNTKEIENTQSETITETQKVAEDNETEKEQKSNVDSNSGLTNATQTAVDSPNKGSGKVIPEKDEENEKLCEELCSTCEGDEQVFDIAEPSCFCKVTTVKSVKCLENKVTDDILMKVIAYVETHPKSEEEKLVAQYLKEREDISLNRHRRCCDHVGASNPRAKQRDGTRQLGIQNIDTSPLQAKQYERRRVGLKKNDVPDVDDEDVGDDTGEEILGARKLDAGPQIENMWRKALRAEETSSERPDPEEDELEVTEKPKQTKRNKLAETRKLYKYEPPANYKSLLGQKQLEPAKTETVAEEDGKEIPKKQIYLGSAKSLKSKQVNNEEEPASEEEKEIPKKPKYLVSSKLSKSKQVNTEEDAPSEEEAKNPTKKQMYLGSSNSLKSKQVKSEEEPASEEENRRDIPKKLKYLVSSKFSKSNKVNTDEDVPSEEEAKKPTKKQMYLGSSKSLKSKQVNNEEEPASEEENKKETPKKQKYLVSSKFPKSNKVDSEEDAPSEEEAKKPTKKQMYLGSSKSFKSKQFNSEEEPVLEKDIKKEIPKKQIYLGSSKSLKSKQVNTEGESLKVDDEIVKKSKKRNEKSKDILKEESEDEEKSQKPEVILSRQSMNDLLDEIKRRNDKQRNKESETEVMKTGSGKYQSLDDLLYERELKRQKFLSSIREKYAPEQSKDEDSISKSNVGEKVDEVKTNKKLSNKKINILGSKSSNLDSEKESSTSSKQADNEEDMEENTKTLPGAKLKAVRDELSEKTKKALKILNDKRIPQKIEDEILGEKNSNADKRKPIVSPFIDDDFKEENKKPNLKYNFKSSKSKDTDNVEAKQTTKEYSDKDNELTGGRKSKESLAALISKIKALYAKDEQEDIVKENTKTRANAKDQKVLGVVKQGDNIKSEKVDNRKSIPRITRKKQYTDETEDEDKEYEDNAGEEDTSLEENSSTYVYPEEIEEDEYQGRKFSKKSKSIFRAENVRPKLSAKSDNQQLISSEENVGNNEVVDKYVKAKYAGVKPSLIREGNGPSRSKTLSFKNNQSNKYRTEVDEEAEDDLREAEEEGEEEKEEDTMEPEEENVKITPKSKYLQKKQEILQKIAEKENEKSISKTLPTKQTTPVESTSMDFDSPEEYQEEKASSELSSEDKKKLLEKSLKEILDKNQNLKMRLLEQRKSPKNVPPSPEMVIPEDEGKDCMMSSPSPKTIPNQEADVLGLTQSSKTVEPEPLKDEVKVPEEPIPKKISLRERLEQRKANKVTSTQVKSNEPQTLDFADMKSLEEEQILSSEKELPLRTSLKEKLEQRKSERSNTRSSSKLESTSKQPVESSVNQESPIVSSQAKRNDADEKAIIEQNPQKHCEHCMEYINQMTRLQKEQMLGQKPYATRSIPLKDGQSADSTDINDESPQEKFLNCRCYESQNGEIVGKVAPSNIQVNSNQYVGATNDAMLGKPFNMQDVSNVFSNIKTGIESSVKGANDKISKGFNDLKTNLQHEYEEVSQKTLGENIKDTSDKMSQKISDLHVKDKVVNGVSTMTQTIQDNYNTIASKGLEENMKEVSNTVSGMTDKMKTDVKQLKDSIISQPAPKMYTSQPPIPYLQAKYIDPNNFNQFQSPMLQSSGNGYAPANQTIN